MDRDGDARPNRGRDRGRFLGTEVARAEVRAPGPHRQQGHVHAAAQCEHLGVPSGVAGEPDGTRTTQQVAQGLRARRPRGDPMFCPDCLDRETSDLGTLAGPKLHDLVRDPAPDRGTEASRHDDDRAALQSLERPPVEVIGMAVRYEHDVNRPELRGVRRRPMPLQRPESIPQERVRQDPNAIYFDEDRGVANVAERDGPFRLRHAVPCVATTTGSPARPGTWRNLLGCRRSVTAAPSSAPDIVSTRSIIVSS